MQELSLNVLDVAQNSITAKATLVEIAVHENHKLDSLVITIKDNGKGMSKEQAQQVTDPFFTTRTTRKVGLGVPFFKMSAEMTGGSFEIASELGIGTTVTASYTLSHIDRMPLGDMNGTIMSLVQCNPTIDFVYTYDLNETAFTADTREFREILGDIPLDTPDVLVFIKGFLEENTNELMNTK